LDERIAELESTAARKGNRKVSLTVSGYINEALLYWNDGKRSDIYQGTNDAARSRFRFVGDAKIDKEWSAGYLLEIGVRSNRLNRTDQLHARGFSNIPTTPGVNTPVEEQLASGLDVRQSTWDPEHASRARVGRSDRPGHRTYYRDQPLSDEPVPQALRSMEWQLPALWCERNAHLEYLGADTAAERLHR
jgi:hypothetical protein